MFENLTPRERKLATAVLGLVPASLVFMGIFWFINSYGANNETAMRLLSDIETEETRMIEGIEAGRRRAFYSSISLPPSLTQASNDYQSWLKLLLEEVQLDVNNVTPRDASEIKHKRDLIGRRRIFSVQARGNLQQLNEFLTRFYEVDLLHRINSLKVIPLTEGAGEKKVRNGQLSIIMAIEIVSLLEADNRDEFTNVLRPRERDVADYQQILRRNIFGPANNEPLLSVRSTTVNSGTDASISVSARDADDQDKLTFELVESSVQGAVLEQSDPTDRRARMTVPSQDPGDYDFKVRVFDSGFPAKESIETFTVTFREPPKPPEPKVEPPKPKFKHAPHTRVTGIARNAEGEWQVWITFRTLQGEDENGLRLRLKEGETFELDDETWVVKRITPDEAFLTAGDKHYVARPNPKDRGILTEVPPPGKDEGDRSSDSAAADRTE